MVGNVKHRTANGKHARQAAEREGPRAGREVPPVDRRAHEALAAPKSEWTRGPGRLGSSLPRRCGRDVALGVRILVRQGRRAALIALTGFMSGWRSLRSSMLVLAAAARADHSVIEHVSQGVTGGNGAFSTSLAAASTDGSAVLLETSGAARRGRHRQPDRLLPACRWCHRARDGRSGKHRARFCESHRDDPDGQPCSSTRVTRSSRRHRQRRRRLHVSRRRHDAALPGTDSMHSSQSFPFGWSDDGARSSSVTGSAHGGRHGLQLRRLRVQRRHAHARCSRGRRDISFVGVSGERCESVLRHRDVAAAGDTDAAARHLHARGRDAHARLHRAGRRERGLQCPRRQGLPPATASLPYREQLGGRGHGLRARHVSSGTRRGHARSCRSARPAATAGRGDPHVPLLRRLAPVLQHDRAARRRPTPMRSRTSTSTRAARRRSSRPVPLVETARSLLPSSSTECPRTAAKSSS